MKKTILTLLTVATLTLCAHAQVEFAVGIKGGLNFAKIDTEDLSTKNRTGFHGGAFALIKLTKIGIQPEILFSQQGSKLQTDGGKVNFDYINVPIILKLYTVAGINIQVGPQFGFISKAEFEDDNGVQDIKDDLKGSDISLALGAGWDLPFGLTIDARYNWGLSDVSDSPALESIKNQVWQVSVGYKLFKLGK